MHVFASFCEDVRTEWLRFKQFALYQWSQSPSFLAVTLFLVLFLPAIAFCLWFLWRWCCADEGGNEEEEGPICNTQFQAWALSAGVGLCLCCVVAFVVVLLLGERRMNTAVEEGGQMINETLPMVSVSSPLAFVFLSACSFPSS